MAWTKQTKKTSTPSNQSKNTSTWTKLTKILLPAKFGTAIFGSSKFGEEKFKWTNQTKH